MKSTDIEGLLKDGFTRKFAKCYLGQAESYKEIKKYDRDYSEWALERGFLADSAYWYGLNENNYQNYLSDYDYYRVWPLNGWGRIWINDKLTLKNLLYGTEYGSIMPDYYYYSTKEGLVPLFENPLKKRIHTIDDLVSVLKEVGTMACKPCNGTSSMGFFKLACDGNTLLLNDKEISKEELSGVINDHPNYVFTEYLTASGSLGKMTPKIHTLRIVVINQIGRDPHFMGGYLRIPTPTSGQANYTHLEGDAEDDFNIVTNYNPNTGVYSDAKFIFLDKAVDAEFYPNTQLKLDGVLAGYEKLKQVVLGICDQYRTLEYMGFDLCCSTNGFKCMEINTHPGMRHMQIFESLLANDNTREYFERKIHDIDNLDESQKRARNGILR